MVAPRRAEILLPLLALLLARAAGGLAEEGAHRWSYEIVGHDGTPVDNPLQVLELSKRQRLGAGVEAAHVCVSLSAATGAGTREQWTPMCFGVNDTRWTRVVMSVGPDAGADVEVTGWSRGLEVGQGAVVWQTTARIGPFVDDKPKDPLARLIEQELAEHAATYSARKYFKRKELFRILSPKHSFSYPSGTTQIDIVVNVVNLQSFGTVVDVCRSLTHVPTGQLKKVCFPIGEPLARADPQSESVLFPWSNDYAKTGSLTGEFVFRIYGINAKGNQVDRGTRSRFTIEPQ